MLSGTQIQLDLRDSSCVCLTYAQPLVTLQDLLNALGQTRLDRPQLLPMLRSTAGHLSRCLGKPPDEITLETLKYLKQGFAAYLRERHYKPASVRSYTNYLTILEKKAIELGFTPDPAGAVAEWDRVIQRMPVGRRCSSIVNYALSLGKRPSEFSDSDLKSWAEAMLAQGRGRTSVMVHKNLFRREIFRLGLAVHLPLLSPPTSSHYAIPLHEFPELLRTQVEKLIKWKTDPMAPGRKGKKRIREISARELQEFICRIVGYVCRVRGESVPSLESLLSEERLTDFLMWCINERKVTPTPLACHWGMLWAAVREFPLLKGHDLSWMPALISILPQDSEAARDEAKRKRWVDYDSLLQIPQKIREEANKKYAATNARNMALAVRNQLLMAWLVTLPWRQRNLRECKLKPRDEGGNLFKEELDRSATIAKPRWVKECLEKNPHEKFWQFYFREHETKTGHVVHALLPKQLVPLLEDYINNHRPSLVRGIDPGFLFLNSEGRPLRTNRVDDLVETLTLRFVGRSVNPHLFRDIFALKWLDEHPEDYLTLSRILWHRNIQTTLRIYGSNYDESHGVRRMEEWLETRNRKPESGVR